MTKAFIDSNVFLYLHDKREQEKGARALALIEEIWRKGKGVISTQILSEFYSIATRKYGLPAADIKQSVLDMARFETVIIRPTHIESGIDISIQYRISYWDGLIVAAAQAVDCSILYTEDLQPGMRFGRLKVVNPFA